MANKNSVFTAYLAHEGFEFELQEELGTKNIFQRYERLFLAEGSPQSVVWADNVWLDPQWIEIGSIGDAAAKLKAIQRNWAGYHFHLHRRAKLIQEKLPHLSSKPVQFPAGPPKAPLGSWTLVKENLILASSLCSSSVPNGAFIFEENKEMPPSRAYLKLWEALLRSAKMPKEGETCLDLGSSPGGWTWVLQTLGAKVISVDKAPLDPKIASLPNVTYMQQSAFALSPEDIGRIDWLFSDVICYPERLLKLVLEWKKSGFVKNFLCTIKFQGQTDQAAIKAFLEIPGSRVLHMYNNKHEVTWFNLED